jgi:hypothetical protein
MPRRVGGFRQDVLLLFLDIGPRGHANVSAFREHLAARDDGHAEQTPLATGVAVSAIG